MSGGKNRKEKAKKLQGLVESIATSLETFSCEIVICEDNDAENHFVKIRNCRSNTFSFSSSLFAVLRPMEGNLEAAIYTYNEEELEKRMPEIQGYKVYLKEDRRV